jgi:hypothetical protein
MKIRLVKHIVDVEAEKISCQYFRDIELPFIPHSGLIVQDKLGSEFIQAVGYLVEGKIFECLTFPCFIGKETPKDSITTELANSGWALDNCRAVVVNFEEKLEEEQVVRDYIADDPELPEEKKLEDGEEDPDAWKKDHDEQYPETELD